MFADFLRSLGVASSCVGERQAAAARPDGRENRPLLLLHRVHHLKGVPTGVRRPDPREASHRPSFGITCSNGIAPNKLPAKLDRNLQTQDDLISIQLEDVVGVMERLPVKELCGHGI